MFKLINSIVQNFAKFLAFTLGSVLTILIWAIGRADAFLMVGIALVVWVLYKIAILINRSFSLILWVPEKLAVASFLFALDISPEEHKETMAAVEKELENKIHLKSFALKRAAAEIERKAEEEEAERLPPVTDFQRGQEDMRERTVAAIALWFERDRKLPAHGGTAQTIQNLILTIPTEPAAEEETENDPS